MGITKVQEGRPAPAILPIPRLPWPRLLASLLSALLLAACYFPIAWGWLAWFALVPVLTLVRSPASTRRLFVCGWVGGFVFFVAALQWMRLADPRMVITWFLLAGYCAFYFPLALILCRRLDRNTSWPLVATFPILWVVLEFCRSHLMTGFGWYLLGHSQHEVLPMIQITDLGGAYAVSFLVALVNALLFEVLWARVWFRTLFSLAGPLPRSNRTRLAFQGLVVLLILGSALAYGAWRLDEASFIAGPRVALVQGNLDIRLKNQAWSQEPEAKSAAEAMRWHHARLTDLAVAYKPDLVIWPETAWPDEWMEIETAEGPLLPAVESLRFSEDLAKLWRTPLLAGINTAVVRDRRAVRRHNSALLIDAQGKPLARYDKTHCVPFGEYVPLRDILPIMNRLSPYDFDYSITPGKSLTRFPLGSWHFGVLICYEDTVSDLARCYGTNRPTEPVVDFLVNISNDGWFDGSAEHEEHLAVARFRAVETRRTVARAVNMGVSAVIDPNGRVLAPEMIQQKGPLTVWEIPDRAPSLPPNRWGEFKSNAGVLLATLPLDGRTTLYSLWGDAFAWMCVSLAGLMLLLSWVAPKTHDLRPSGSQP